MAYWLILLLPLLAPAKSPIEVDALVAKVGREAVLESDLLRFKEVIGVLSCAGVLERENLEKLGHKALLEAYIEEELMYQEARSKKMSTVGLIPNAVHAIHKKEECKERWQKMGQDFSRFYRTDTRAREGESLLVRELEKRVLVEHFRKTELIADGELWRREARNRYPVKVFTE
jgi:hypothetical protein